MSESSVSKQVCCPQLILLNPVPISNTFDTKCDGKTVTVFEAPDKCHAPERLLIQIRNVGTCPITLTATLANDCKQFIRIIPPIGPGGGPFDAEIISLCKPLSIQIQCSASTDTESMCSYRFNIISNFTCVNCNSSNKHHKKKRKKKEDKEEKEDKEDKFCKQNKQICCTNPINILSLSSSGDFPSYSFIGTCDGVVRPIFEAANKCAIPERISFSVTNRGECPITLTALFNKSPNITRTIPAGLGTANPAQEFVFTDPVTIQLQCPSTGSLCAWNVIFHSIIDCIKC